MKKTIKIGGEDFYYQVIYDCDAHGTIYELTEFFKETYQKTRKKYLFFGPLITETFYHELFSVGIDIESTFYTKEYVHNEVYHAHNKYMALLRRPEEIKRGEII